MVERGFGAKWLISRMGLGSELKDTLSYLETLMKRELK